MLFSCRQNENKNEDITEQKTITSITKSNNEITKKSKVSEQKSNILIGKYFYVCTSIDSQFDNFFKEDGYFNVLHFTDENTVIHSMFTGSWTQASMGTYKFEDNKLCLKISSLVSGHIVLKGELKRLTKTNYVLVDTGLSGQDIEELKLINFTPQ